MVKSTEDVEALLLRLERRFERQADETILVHLSAGQPPAALRLGEPLLVAQVVIGAIPEGDARQARLFRRLLELNASELAHAAYAIVAGEILLVAALDLLTLDPSELESTLSDFDLALGGHVASLKQLSEQPAQ
jgi:Putative bacterial sensory transduction regulator